MASFLKSRLPFLVPTKIASIRKYGVPSGYYEHPTMNELPVPCIPWDMYYKKKQGHYNLILLLGFGWFVFSAISMVASGSFYLNWGPPCEPGPSAIIDDNSEMDALADGDNFSTC